MGKHLEIWDDEKPNDIQTIQAPNVHIGIVPSSQRLNMEQYPQFQYAMSYILSTSTAIPDLYTGKTGNNKIRFREHAKNKAIDFIITISLPGKSMSESQASYAEDEFHRLLKLLNNSKLINLKNVAPTKYRISQREQHEMDLMILGAIKILNSLDEDTISIDKNPFGPNAKKITETLMKKYEILAHKNNSDRRHKKVAEYLIESEYGVFAHSALRQALLICFSTINKDSNASVKLHKMARQRKNKGKIFFIKPQNGSGKYRTTAIDSSLHMSTGLKNTRQFLDKLSFVASELKSDFKITELYIDGTKQVIFDKQQKTDVFISRSR